MCHTCYVCGFRIHDDRPYYRAGYDIYICDAPDCWKWYFWHKYSLDIMANRSHEYAVINGEAYQIGSEADEPRGFGGRKHTILFKDGTEVTTHSLWSRGKVPSEWREIIKDNAEFKV